MSTWFSSEQPLAYTGRAYIAPLGDLVDVDMDESAAAQQASKNNSDTGPTRVPLNKRRSPPRATRSRRARMPVSLSDAPQHDRPNSEEK